MMRARTGRVIFMSSVVGEAGNAGQTAYAASKAALLGLTRSLAREYVGRGITVNAVAPGYVDTDMTRALTPEQRENVLKSVPLGRVATAREIATGVVYLASDEASYVTGQVLRINGGMYM
jgi:3-oxoacyl-[acyl-carrier protein] reductase